MSCVIRKPVFGVSHQVQHELGFTITDDGQRPEISDFGSSGVVQCISKKNKGADQLHGYHAADLRLCLFICQKQVFS